MSTETMTETGSGVDARTLRSRVRAAMERHTISQNALAKRISMSAASVSQWLKGSYAGDNARVDEAMRRWLDGLDAQLDLQSVSAETPGFQRTQTSERIWAMLMQAQRAPAIVVAAGVPGIGKTMTANAYAKANNNVWLATMDPSLGTPALVMNEIAFVMGIPTGSPMALRHSLGERFEGSEGLLIIDEAQHCSPKALDLLRSLHDRYGIGIAFLGNYGLFAGTTAPSKTHGFAQFYRRVRKRAKFEEPAKADVELILDAWGVTDRESREFLARIAGKMWGLSGITNTIGEATTLALGSGEPMGLRHLRAAWAGLNHFEG